MKTSVLPRVLAVFGSLVMSAIVIAPYEVASAVRAIYSAVQANSAGWRAPVLKASVPYSHPQLASSFGRHDV
jgi:hypothetical protein